MRRGARHPALALLLLVAAHASGGALAERPDAGNGGVEVLVDSSSPRAAVAAFLDLSREGRYEEAAEYLDLPGGKDDQGAVLAKKLKSVLDRYLWVDLATLSGEASGELEPGVAAGLEIVGVVRPPKGKPLTIRLIRRETAEGLRWRFTQATVMGAERLYAQMEHRWALDHLPEFLLLPGPWELLWWQWVMLPLLLLLTLPFARVAGRLSVGLLQRLTGDRAGGPTSAFSRRLRLPLWIAWWMLFSHLGVPLLGLYAPAEAFVRGLLRAGLLVAVYLATMRAIDIGARMVGESPWTKGHPGFEGMLPVLSRIAKVLVGVLAVIVVLSLFGVSVASLLAGLGIGGLAVALAAQKTGENLFGSISLAVDQPLKVGNFVRIEDFVGTVEVIGLRSTQIRTLDRTLITLPNGKLADMRIENFSARDRMRLACDVGLVYQTTAAQMRAVLEGLEARLRAHPKITEDVIVRFKELGSSALLIQVMAWFDTPDWNEFQKIRQDVLLEFMEVVERAGTSFAFPTQTIHLAREPREPAA